ncbi:MAG: sterol desaturase family protein [Flavobacteriales bacterium]|nr:sterol desaturase family protein [Flavobacteriales bacterium]
MNIYAIITPIILGLLLFEFIYCLIKNNGYYKFQDTIANFGTAIGNQCVNLVVAVLVYKSYGYLFDNFSLWNVEPTWWSYIILLILIDFLFYWFHRIGHTINIFWAAHMPHHSSEEMNMAVGLRASVTQRLFSFLFYWPLPILGFSPEMIYTMTALHLLNGFWHHTRVIPKLGWFEKYFNSPSHHRVHHGTNTQYLDKNYGELLIIWDKIFGTFEEEHEEVCYGVTHPPRTWDPMNIYFQYWKQLWDDAVAAPYWIDKFRVWFMPLGWRPRGLEPHPDIGIGVTVDQQVKYKSKHFRGAKPYLIVHLILGIFVMYLTIDGKSPFTVPEKLTMTFLIFIMISAWGGILQSKKWASFIENFRLIGMAVLMAFAFNREFSFDWLSVPMISLFAVTAVSAFYAGHVFRKHNEEVEEEAESNLQANPA